MFCTIIRSFINSLTAAFDNGLLPPLPRATNDFSRVRKTETAVRWDLDPKVKREQERYVDQVAYNFLPKDILPPDLLDDLLVNGTRSNFVEADRHKPFVAAISFDYEPYDDPPAGITDKMLHELAIQAVDVFGLRLPGTKLANYDATSWPPNHGAGLGYHGTKQENYPNAKNRCEKMMSHIAANGFDSMTYPRYAGISRTQIATVTESKTRLIWYISFHLLLMQLRLFTPILNAFLACKSKPCIGGLTLEAATEKFNEHFTLPTDKDEPLVYFNVDYPSFDTGKVYEDETGKSTYAAGMQPWEYRWIALVLLYAYKSNEGTRWDMNILFYLSVYMHSAVNKRIQVGSTLYFVRGMMASGDGPTYFDDTITAWMRFQVTCILMKIPKPTQLYYGGGDDGIVAMSLKYYDRKRINQYVHTLFRSNWKLPPHSEVSSELSLVKFHGRYWHRQQWYRPLAYVVLLLLFREHSDLLFNPPLYRERGRADAAISLQRILSIYEDSGKRYYWLLRMAAELQEHFPGLQPRMGPDPEFYSLFGVF